MAAWQHVFWRPACDEGIRSGQQNRSKVCCSQKLKSYLQSALNLLEKHLAELKNIEKCENGARVKKEVQFSRKNST